MNYWTQSAKNIYVAAHRGWCTKYPENTMEAFKAALDVGVDQIETDVRVSKDGQLVLIHDATVDRTTNGTGKVKDLTLAELKALDAGSHKGAEFAGCRIPTLIEFMELVKDHPTITLDIELKTEAPDEDWFEHACDECDRVMEIVERYGFQDRVVINTFSAKFHEYILEKYGSKCKQHVYYPLRHMGDATKDPYRYGYCVCMFKNDDSPVNMATVEEFNRMRETYGIEPWAGAAVKDEATVDMAIARGAALITCNNPDVILKLLKEKGYHK